MPALPESKAASQSRWESHKETLRTLYLVEKRTLKEVVEYMAKFNNLDATESQYEHVFREWGFEKNLKRSDWIAIDHHMSKRKRDGKENELLHNGVVVPPKKVRKETLRNRRASSPRMGGVPSPRLPKGVTIRTPAVSPKVPAAVFESPTLSAAEDITMFGLIDRFSSQSAFEHASSQISTSADRELWAESYVLRDHVRSHFPGTTHDLVPYTPQQSCSSQYADELLSDRGLGPGLQEFASLENFGGFGSFSDIMNLQWSTSPTGASDSFRDIFNSTPVTTQGYLGVSNWSGKYSGALYNLPWFRFQQLATGSFYSHARFDHCDHALQSLLDGVKHAQVQRNMDLEDRQRLLSGLVGSGTTPSSLQRLPQIKSLLQDLVPERFDGDIEHKLQHLFDPANNCSLFQVSEFHLYFLSNNKFTERQIDNLFESIAKQKPLGPLKTLLQMKTPTAQVFCHKFLESTVRRGDIASLQLLMDCGIDRSSLSGASGGKHLQAALMYDKPDIAEYLLGNGAEVNPVLGRFPHNQPPLHSAVQRGYYGVVKRLIDAGANVNVRSAEGETALVYGIQWSNQSTDCIRLLLDGGANVDNAKIDDLSLLDWVYLNKREKLYGIILSRSQQAKNSLTISGILYAANVSRQALSQYLNSMPPTDDWQRQNKLESALCEAASHSDQPLEVVHILLEFGVDPNVKTTSGESAPLIMAAMTNDIDMAELLLDAGADINTPGVLSTAAEVDDNYDILKFLIEQGADVETFGADTLRCADLVTGFANVRLLLRSGADVNYIAAPKGGKTLLQRAVWNNNTKAVRYLIDHGAEINAPASHSDGGTALQTAALKGNIAMVKLLLTLGADVNGAPSRSGGETALEASALCKTPSKWAELFQLLLGHGAAINRPQAQRCYRNWSSALTNLAKRSAGEDLIRCALAAGADVNEPGHGNGTRTPIQAAAESGSTTTVQLLLDNGADVNAPPGMEYGRTALQAACSTDASNVELVKLLLNKGADVNAPAGFKRGLTALQGAAIRGHWKIALMLLDAGAEVNAEPAAIHGRTALDGAAENGRLEMVQMLLNLGAESEEPGATGFDMAIELAEIHDHFAVVDLLKSHGQKD